MTGLVYSEKLGRQIRTDRIGISTYTLIGDAIKNDRKEEVLTLLNYLLIEGKDMHDWGYEWAYADLTFIADTFGEQYVPEALLFAYQILNRPLLRKVPALNVGELVQKYAEIMRGHRCGPAGRGDFEVVEEEDRWVMKFDPCGTGGSMRRGEVQYGRTPITDPPSNLGVTKKAYPWSWGKVGVPYYCVHCCVWHEIGGIEARGYPTKITEYSPDPQDPCIWYFYKEPDLIPEYYFTRVGKKKDPSKWQK